MQNDLQTVAGVLKKYRSDTGAYPATLEEADVTTASGATFTYQRDYLSGSFCLMGTIEEVSYYIESDNRSPKEGVCPIVNVAMNPGAEVSTWGVSGYFSSPVTRVSTTGGPDAGYSFQTTTNSTTNRQGLIHTGAYAGEGWGAKTLTLTTGWQRDSITFTTPSTVGRLYIQYRLTSPASGVGIRTDGIMCTEGSVDYEFADGDTTGWEWLGDPGLSASKGLPL